MIEVGTMLPTDGLEKDRPCTGRMAALFDVTLGIPIESETSQ